MSAEVVVQASVDAEVEQRASAVLRELGLTVPDAVRLLLERTAEEGALPIELETPEPGYDAWFREQVQAALDDDSPDVPHEEVEAYFAEKRAALKRSVNEA